MSPRRRKAPPEPKSWIVRVKRTDTVEYIIEGTEEEAHRLTGKIIDETIIDSVDDHIMSVEENV